MGAADIIPGVSGGTIALIVGIYDRLVRAIAALDPRIMRHVMEPGRFVEELRAMDLPFLLVLGAGIMTAVLLVSRVILVVFLAYPAQVNAFFFGLIAASAIVIFRDVTVNTVGRGATALSGFLIAFFVAGLAAGGGFHSRPVLFLAGAIAISAMILPGISGAAFLYILGQYEFLLDALRQTVDGVLTLEFAGDTVDALTAVVIFLSGAVIGLLTTAHVVAWALARSRQATMAFLVSLMVGALRLPVEEIYAITGVPGGLTAGGLLLTALIGVAVVLVLDRATGSLEYV